MTRLPGMARIACRVCVAAVAGLAVVATPMISAGQAARNQTDRNPIGARDLVFDLDTADAPVPPPTVPRGYALVIGVGDYRNLDESQQLPFAESDAQAMFRVLISHQGGAFPAENVRMLAGEQASLANIRHALEEWLPSVARPADRVVVYFVGHGFVKDGRGYLAPWDVDPRRLDETAYPMTTLGDVMANRIQSHWKVLFTDACHSGKINAETTNEALDLQLSSLPQSFLTLTAATEREQAYYDTRLANGFFTHFLTRAFEGHADNDPCDGQITAAEVVEFVRANVRHRARTNGLFQTPTARGDYDPRMPLGVNSECIATARPGLASQLGTAIVEVNLDNVALFLDGEPVGTLTKGEPRELAGLAAGLHEFMGVRRGYEPDTKQIMIAPGQRVTVTLRIRYPRRQVRPEARDLGEEGERLLFTQRSTVNPLNLVPVARSQSSEDIERARELFLAALEADPGYPEAAYHLGQVHQLLGDYSASIDAYRRALGIDPGYAEARVQLAAVLLESGDPDEAIRELTDAARLEQPTDELYAMLARAYWDKGAWAQAVGEAQRALELNPSNSPAHLWKADALRMQIAEHDDIPPLVRQSLYREAGEGYREFLKQTNFESSVGERLAFHFLGFGIGRRRHADREHVYRDLRTAGNLGLCITEGKLEHPLRAREYCERAIGYRDDHAIAHFLLGNVNRDLVNLYLETLPEVAGRGSAAAVAFHRNTMCDYLTAAARSYSRMIEINSDLSESDHARYYLEQITRITPQVGCSGPQ